MTTPALIVCSGDTYRRFEGRRFTHKAEAHRPTAEAIEEFRVNPEGLSVEEEEVCEKGPEVA